MSAQELAATVIAAVLDGTQVPPEAIDDVLGQGFASGDAPAISPMAADAAALAR